MLLSVANWASYPAGSAQVMAGRFPFQKNVKNSVGYLSTEIRWLLVPPVLRQVLQLRCLFPQPPYWNHKQVRSKAHGAFTLVLLSTSIEVPTYILQFPCLLLIHLPDNRPKFHLATLQPSVSPLTHLTGWIHVSTLTMTSGFTESTKGALQSPQSHQTAKTPSRYRPCSSRMDKTRCHNFGPSSNVVVIPDPSVQ